MGKGLNEELQKQQNVQKTKFTTKYEEKEFQKPQEFAELQNVLQEHLIVEELRKDMQEADVTSMQETVSYHPELMMDAVQKESDSFYVTSQQGELRKSLLLSGKKLSGNTEKEYAEEYRDWMILKKKSAPKDFARAASSSPLE